MTTPPPSGERIADTQRPKPSAGTRGRLVAVIAAILVLAALHFTRPVMLPLAAGFLIAALAWPAFHWLQSVTRRGIALLATVLIVTTTIVAIVGAVGWGAARVVQRVRDHPERLTSLQLRVNDVSGRLGIAAPDLGFDRDTSDSPESRPDTASSGRGSRSDSGSGITVTGTGDRAQGGNMDRGALAKRFGIGLYSMFGYLALAVGFAALVLAEIRTTRDKLLLRFGEQRGQRMLGIGAELALAMRRYVKVKSVTSVIAGVVTGALSLLFGIEFAALWAFLAFLFEYVPTIGSILAVVPPVAYALIQFDDLTRPMVALAVFTVAQLFLGNYVDPRLEGRLLSLSPLVVLFSIVFWAWLWGAPGSLLGVPIAVAVTVVARHFESTRWIWAVLTEPHDDERSGTQGGAAPKPGVSR